MADTGSWWLIDSAFKLMVWIVASSRLTIDNDHELGCQNDEHATTVSHAWSGNSTSLTPRGCCETPFATTISNQHSHGVVSTDNCMGKTNPFGLRPNMSTLVQPNPDIGNCFRERVTDQSPSFESGVKTLSQIPPAVKTRWQSPAWKSSKLAIAASPWSQFSVGQLFHMFRQLTIDQTQKARMALHNLSILESHIWVNIYGRTNCQDAAAIPGLQW